LVLQGNAAGNEPPARGRGGAPLAASRVWLFHGEKDAGVPRATIAEMASFYRMMGVPAGNIAEEEGPDAEHGMPVKAQPRAPTGPRCALHDPAFLREIEHKLRDARCASRVDNSPVTVAYNDPVRKTGERLAW